MTNQSFLANSGNFDQAFAAAPVKVAQTYSYQYNGAMAMGPECCVAKVTPQGAHIFSNTQNIWSTRSGALAAMREVMGTNAPPENRIRVTYYEGGSVYGGASPYDDVSHAAVVMSALTGSPVRLQFMRWDSHGWGNYGPPLLADMRGSVDANGKITGFEMSAFVHAYYSTTPTMQQLTGSAQFSSGAGQLNSQMTGTAYDIGSRKVLRKTIPLEDNAFKMRHLRAPMSPQTAFASEQLVDELAYAAKIDPVEFRIRNIANFSADPQQRWKNALEQATRAANWQPRVAASRLASGNVVTGRGVSLGYYSNSPAAGVVEIEVNKRTGKIAVKNVYASMDAGFVVYPDGLKNNEEGGVIQGVSRALHEAVAFNRKGVTGLDWVSYPILRFADAPRIHLSVASRTDVPQSDNTTVAAQGSRSTGAGEPTVTPIPAAIANAFFDATGVRIRQAPMTPAVVRAVLRAGGR
jgi:CO/xanthine dehydrogenase Mo-binding subunit